MTKIYETITTISAGRQDRKGMRNPQDPNPLQLEIRYHPEFAAPFVDAIQAREEMKEEMAKSES